MGIRKENFIIKWMKTYSENDSEIIKMYFTIKNSYNDKSLLQSLFEKFKFENIEELFIKINEIKKLGKDSSSLKSFIIRHGEEEGIKLFKEKSKKCTITKENFIKKYGEEEGLIKFKESKICNNLDFLIKKYGEEEGKKRYEKYVKNYSKSNSLNGYIEKHGEERGEKMWKERLERSSISKTLIHYKKLFGEEEGEKRWKEKSKKRVYSQTLEGCIERFGEEEGRKHRQQILKGKIRNLETFILKHGEKKGTEKYIERNKKISKSSSLSGYIERFGEEEGIKLHVEKVMKSIAKNNNKMYSKDSQTLFDQFNIKESNYYTNNGEIRLVSENGKVFLYDFYWNNKIIEYNGDFWHANPKIYNADDNVYFNVKAETLWKKDEIKNKLAIDKGYELLIIWENDYKKDPIQTIQICKNFLKI